MARGIVRICVWWQLRHMRKLMRLLRRLDRLNEKIKAELEGMANG